MFYVLIKYFNSQPSPQQDHKLWDSFQDPPISEIHGSSVDSKLITNSIKCMKIFTYWFVLFTVACSGVLSKLSFLLMTSNVAKNTKIPFCDSQSESQKHFYDTSNMFLFLSASEKKFVATIPIEQNKAWCLAIIFAFSIPEVGTLLRSLRLCFFKKVKNFKWEEFGIVMFAETLYVIGMSLMAFAVLPELEDAMQGVMITNCLCLVPSLLCELNYLFLRFKKYLNILFAQRCSQDRWMSLKIKLKKF